MDSGTRRDETPPIVTGPGGEYRRGFWPKPTAANGDPNRRRRFGQLCHAVIGAVLVGLILCWPRGPKPNPTLTPGPVTHGVVLPFEEQTARQETTSVSSRETSAAVDATARGGRDVAAPVRPDGPAAGPGAGVHIGRETAMRFEIYRDAAREWRWRLRAGNGRIIADSGEGYADKAGCSDAIDLVKAGSGGAEVVELPE